MGISDYFSGWWKCFDKVQFTKIYKTLPDLYKSTLVYPNFKEVFKAFKLCKYEDVRVVILGQDPYFDGNATGLAFANKNDAKKLSPSLEILKNSFKNLQNQQEYTIFVPDLESLAKQGVLLLNTSLTVAAGKPGSHTMLWRPFISSFIKGLSEWNPGLVYVLLGEQAKSFKPYIGKFNDIIECRHPAYYARIGEEMPDIFREVDRLTISKNNFKIKWL